MFGVTMHVHRTKVPQEETVVCFHEKMIPKHNGCSLFGSVTVNLRFEGFCDNKSQIFVLKVSPFEDTDIHMLSLENLIEKQLDKITMYPKRYC